MEIRMNPQRSALKLLSLTLAVLLAVAPVAADPQAAGTKKSRAKSAKTAKAVAVPMTEDQKAEHVLNRLGFGPRPGDIERVRQTGVSAWIEQQLNPEKLDDLALEQRLEPMAT